MTLVSQLGVTNLGLILELQPWLKLTALFLLSLNSVLLTFEPTERVTAVLVTADAVGNRDGECLYHVRHLLESFFRLSDCPYFYFILA